MPYKIPVIPGDRSGKLTAIRETDPVVRGTTPSGTPKMYRQVLCVCDCGTEEVFWLGNFRHRKSVQCSDCRNAIIGEKRKTHGMSDTPEYYTWISMGERCGNKNVKNYDRYGGRGISVCDRWTGKGGFENFISDMGERPSSKHSIDRIDNDGNYEPSNCQWVTSTKQANNRRSNRTIELLGKHVTLATASRISGLSAGTIVSQIDKQGMPPLAVMLSSIQFMRNKSANRDHHCRAWLLWQAINEAEIKSTTEHIQ